jgi:N-hydroxyarylamine O-acetyltransferase
MSVAAVRPTVDPEAYLARIGLSPADATPPDRETLARLQRAHVTTVPFETLSIAGDPFGRREGEGVSVDPEASYRKVVERDRGGFCYELNGPFGRLLSELGYEVDRVAAMVTTDGGAGPPANHLTHVVDLDRRYVVDVGMGAPTMRRPTPLDGTPRTDGVGVTWRVVGSDRPDADYATQYRGHGDEEWTERYVFADRPRSIDHFEATCEYLATAPESPFTGEPVVTRATDGGHVRLTADAVEYVDGGDRRERPLVEAEWFAVLEREFGVAFGPADPRD